MDKEATTSSDTAKMDKEDTTSSDTAKMDKEDTTSSDTFLKKTDLSKQPLVDRSQSPAPSSSQNTTSDRIEENILEEQRLETSLERTNNYMGRLKKQLADIKINIDRQENLKQKLQRQLASNKKKRKFLGALLKDEKEKESEKKSKRKLDFDSDDEALSKLDL